MSDRRRAPRFVLPQPAEGDLRVHHDVLVGWHTGERVVVIAPEPAIRHEWVWLEVRLPDGREGSCRAEVLSSAPVLRGGVVRFRIELRADALPPDDGEYRSRQD